MTITRSLNRRKGVLTEIRHGVKRLEVELFVRVMVRKSTTKGLIEKVDYEMYRQGWYLVSLIVHGNLSGHS